MARGQSSNVSAYAAGKWSAADSSWCDFMDRVQGIDERADVVGAVLRVLRRCHVALWAASSFKSRKSWSIDAKAAFQVSEGDLASSTGLSRHRVRTALRVAEERGLIVRLSEQRPKGEGRGSVPAVYTFDYLAAGAPPKSSTVAAVGKAGKKKAGKAAASLADKWGVSHES